MRPLGVVVHLLRAELLKCPSGTPAAMRGDQAQRKETKGQRERRRLRNRGNDNSQGKWRIRLRVNREVGEIDDPGVDASLSAAESQLLERPSRPARTVEG